MANVDYMRSWDKFDVKAWALNEVCLDEEDAQRFVSQKINGDTLFDDMKKQYVYAVNSVNCVSL